MSSSEPCCYLRPWFKRVDDSTLEDVVTIADPGLGGGVAPPEPYIRVGVPPQVLGAFLSSFLL